MLGHYTLTYLKVFFLGFKEPQYTALSFSLTRTVLCLKEAALDSLLKTYQENYLHDISEQIRFNRLFIPKLFDMQGINL